MCVRGFMIGLVRFVRMAQPKGGVQFEKIKKVSPC